MDNKVGIVICARVKSSRIPEKVLQKINGRRAIEILLNNVVNDKYDTILAIPENSEDDILEDIATKKGIDVYRGEDDSPLHRLYSCARKHEFDHVVRITTDDILIDQSLMRNQIKHHLRGANDYTYMSRCPEGIATEVIDVNILEKVVGAVGNKPIEFVSYYIKKMCKGMEYYPPFDYQYTAWLVMDYPEDLMLLRVLFSALAEPFGTLDIINFLKRHKYFLQINHLPEVTLYTCNYNQGKYITDCLDSMFEQTYKNYEVIIIDDCSTDNSVNIIAEYMTNISKDKASKIKVYRNDRNIGLPASSNKALNYARGKYLMRIDSDDMLLPEYLEIAIERIKIDDISGLMTAYYEVDEKGEKITEINENMMHPGYCLLSRVCINELKYQEDLQYLEGQEFFNRFKKKFKTAFIPRPLWKYRQHPEQKTKQKDHPNNEEN